MLKRKPTGYLESSKHILLGFLCSCLVLFSTTAFSAAQTASNWLDEPINISFHNEPLSKVLKQISEQTGVSIAYDQELADEKVTGNYQNVKTSDAITRIFRSKNKSIQVNKAKKIVIVKTFGAKSFIWAGAIQGQNNSSQMTLAELEKMHAQQYKEYKERIADDNEILEGGITRGEMKAMHERQYAEYKKRIQNDKAVLEGGGGITRGELKAMHTQQYKTYMAHIANDNEVLNGTMTRGEMKAMHEQQYAQYKKRIANDNEILEGGNGMTRKELRIMHEQQYSEFKAQQSKQ